MNSKVKFIIALVAVLVFSATACTASAQTLNSAEDLKAYLDKQPVNGPDKPIRVSMTINDPMLKNVADVLKSAGKYVILNISGSALTTIPSSAFKGNETLASITIPNSVKSIGESAFQGCTNLTSVTIGTGVTSIPWNTFSGCTGLTTINVNTGNSSYISENGVLFNKDKTILSQYPKGKTGAFTIPDSVTSIGNGAFNSCTNLTSINIPNSVTSIGTGAFLDCIGLTSVTIPNSVSSIGMSVFFGCTGLTSLTIGTGVTNIGVYAFNNCTGLTSITIPNSDIEEWAFFECKGLTSVTIGNGVTSIGNGAFYGCNSLTSVKFEDTITSNNFGSQVFFGDLRDKYLARGGGPGTYTRPSGGNTWTKQ